MIPHSTENIVYLVTRVEAVSAVVAHKRVLPGSISTNVMIVISVISFKTLTLCLEINKKCMKLQSRVEEEKNNNEFINELFKRLIPVFSEIMMDPYANYFCQKLLTLANEDHITKILEHIKDKFVDICINTHGTRAGQNLVEKMKLNKERIRLIRRALKKDVITLATNKHGNHVINICLNRFPASEIDFIVDAFVENCKEVSTHQHGCMVMQKCLTKCTDEQRKRLAKQVVQDCLFLAQNQFGNYIIQNII